MKKIYFVPTCQVTELENKDIICNSGEVSIVETLTEKGYLTATFGKGDSGLEDGFYF